MSDRRENHRCALVTGATGYIGSNLVKRLLADGWTVHIIVRQDSRPDALGLLTDLVVIHKHDGHTRCMVEIVAKTKPDIVFHLASLYLAQHNPDDIEALVGSNLLFATQLTEAMAANGVRYLVNTGTSWQHYKNANYDPVNLYAATKQAFEDILAYYVESQGIIVTSLSLCDTYGPNDPRRKLISLLWEATRTQDPLVMSPGEQMIDLVHIDDVLTAFMMAAEIIPKQNEGHSRYAVSSGHALRLIDLVAEFQRATGIVLSIIWGGRPYRPREVMIPWTDHRPVPNWRPEVPFEKGILQTRPSGLSKKLDD